MPYSTLQGTQCTQENYAKSHQVGMERHVGEAPTPFLGRLEDIYPAPPVPAYPEHFVQLAATGEAHLMQATDQNYGV